MFVRTLHRVLGTQQIDTGVVRTGSKTLRSAKDSSVRIRNQSSGTWFKGMRAMGLGGLALLSLTGCDRIGGLVNGANTAQPVVTAPAPTATPTPCNTQEAQQLRTQLATVTGERDALQARVADLDEEKRALGLTEDQRIAANGPLDSPARTQALMAQLAGWSPELRNRVQAQLTEAVDHWAFARATYRNAEEGEIPRTAVALDVQDILGELAANGHICVGDAHDIQINEGQSTRVIANGTAREIRSLNDLRSWLNAHFPVDTPAT